MIMIYGCSWKLVGTGPYIQLFCACNTYVCSVLDWQVRGELLHACMRRWWTRTSKLPIILLYIMCGHQCTHLYAYTMDTESMPAYIAGPTCAVHVIKQAFHKLHYIASIMLPNIDNS